MLAPRYKLTLDAPVSLPKLSNGTYAERAAMNKLELDVIETVASAIATGKSKHAPAKPVLLLTWSLDPTTGKPVGRWIVEAPALAPATAA